MGKKFYSFIAVVLSVVVLYCVIVGVNSPSAQTRAVKVETCYECHEEIKDFHTKGKHSKVNCITCHSKLDEHAKDPSVRPVTNLEHSNCGRCHREQYESFVSVNLAKHERVKKEKATSTGRSPNFDKLMRPHGFTREHAEPRSHVFMLVDHLLVDRAYGGRFRLKNWSLLGDGKSSEKSAWDILYDVEPGTSDQKTFLPFSATAANPSCINCKTTDHILDWAYMGDKNPNAKWDRTSKIVEFARSINRPMACVHCHDPHSAGPRVVRDALINAVVDRGEGTYPYDKEKSKKTTLTKVTFRDFRAIGILNRSDSNLMCAQCHVEYNCNPGIDLSTGQQVTMADRRTNLFQWTNVFDYTKRMLEEFKFADFKNAETGAYILKIQHPETETFWGSKHERAGVECKDCHMPKIKNPKTGKTYTSHAMRSPRYGFIKETCLRCHTNWSEEEALYVINGVKNYIRGKMEKAEFWLGELINTFKLAQALGVPEDVLEQARKLHTEAHVYWEWWTAENSDGFHNPEQARESLGKSILISQKAIEILNKAIEERRKTSEQAK